MFTRELIKKVNAITTTPRYEAFMKLAADVIPRVKDMDEDELMKAHDKMAKACMNLGVTYETEYKANQQWNLYADEFQKRIKELGIRMY